MLSERAITYALKILNRRYLSQNPCESLTCLPGPEAHKNYTLYAHIPFCERLCLYCSFNRFLFQEERARHYLKHLREEMRMVAELGYDFPSLYVGGGTPTILLDELVETIDLATSLFSIKEVSCETSPNHLGPELIEALADRVHRLSVGVQTFDDSVLGQMDRLQKYGSGEELFEKIKGMEGLFHSLNVDMIFNFPSQTEEMLLRDTEMLIATGANQTTFYPLMASSDTRKKLAGAIGNVSYEREAHFFRVITEALSPTFTPSAAWTYSRDANAMIDEYIVDYGEYVGIGSGALSFLDGRLYGNTFSLGEYADMISSGRMSVLKRSGQYSRKAKMRYRFVTDLFGLRLDKKRFERDLGVSVERGLGLEMAFMKAAGGIATDTETEVTLTEKGRYLLLVMMRESLTAQNEHRDLERAALPVEEKLLLLEGDGAGDHTLREASAG